MEDGLVHDFMLKFHNDLRYQVLILVVMEDGLVQIMKISVKGGGAVLILVVMEDGLVHYGQISVGRNGDVLILVVMEDGLVLDLIRLY